jgi:hypothetical protein
MRKRMNRLALAHLRAIAERNNMVMAAPADVSPDLTIPLASADTMRQQINNIIAALRIITAKLDLDAGVTDVNYFALSCDAAVATAPVKIKGF